MRWTIMELQPDPAWATWQPGQAMPAVFIELKANEIYAAGNFHVLAGIKHEQMSPGVMDCIADWTMCPVGSKIVSVRVFPLQVPELSGLAILAGMQMSLEWYRTLRTAKPLVEGFMFLGKEPAATMKMGEVQSARHWIGLAVRESK